MFGRALLAKKLALMRLEHTFQYFSALRSLRIGDSHSGDVEPLLCVPLCVTLPDPQSGLRNEAEASPLKIGPQFENVGHGPERSAISLPRHYALVLIFDPGLIRLQLAQNHDDRLQNIQRLKTGNSDRFVFVLSNPLVRTTTNHS